VCGIPAFSEAVMVFRVSEKKIFIATHFYSISFASENIQSINSIPINSL